MAPILASVDVSKRVTIVTMYRQSRAESGRCGSMLRSLLVLVALTAPAHANVAKWWGEGARTSEPGGLHDIAIEHEDLRFDMRPVALEGGADVSATYFLDNHGTTTVTTPLVFVAGSRMGDLDVLFDRAPQKSHNLTEQEVAAFPAAWKAPLE